MRPLFLLGEKMDNRIEYYIIPTIVVSATDNILNVEIKWWTFGLGIEFIRY